MQTRKNPGILRDYWLELVLFIATLSIVVSDCYSDQKKHNLGVQICHPHKIVDINQNNNYAVCQDVNGKKLLKEFK